MAETDAASVITPSVTTAVTFVVGAATSTSIAQQIFNPLQGVYISDPLVITGNGVVSSRVEWGATTPAAGSTATFYTTINGGLTWDPVATSGSSVPRLLAGYITTQQVQVKVVLTRLLGTDATPRVQFLRLQVVSDSSTDELVPIANGMVTKVAVTSVGGQGAGSGGGSGGVGVSGKGGGQYGGGPSIKVSGIDLSRAISRNVWQQPFVVPEGLTYAQAVQAMVINRLIEQSDFSITSVPQVVPGPLVYGMQQGTDPWQDIRDLAAAVGCEVFFDPLGTFVFRPVPDPRRTAPVWTFDDTVNPVTVKSVRELSDENTYNYVVVKGEATSSANPVAAVAFDDDPSSPTYIFGDYGQVVEYVTLPQVVTADQAQAAANAILFASLGVSDTVTLTGVPMPALEPGDIVRVVSTDVRANGVYMINKVTTPLSPAEAQEIEAFRQSQQI